MELFANRLRSFSDEFMHDWTVYSLTCSCLFIVSSLIWLMYCTVFFTRCYAYFTLKFMYHIYSHINRSTYTLTPSLHIKKCPKLPHISQRWGGTSISGLLGVTFVQEAWRCRAPGRLQATPRCHRGHCDDAVEAGRWVVRERWWRANPVSKEHHSLLVVIGMSTTDSMSSTVHRHRHALVAFGTRFAKTINHQLA